MPAQYAIGIDLGTTNSVLAYARLGEERPQLQLLPIPQLVAAGTVEERNVLPSFLYLGTDADAASGAYDLPWEKGRRDAVGALAQKQAADVPTRTVAAAKSWLAYSRVDRHQPILPWNAPPDVAKVSPVEAAKRYLQHIVAAWGARFHDAPIAEQQVVLTVPASFDASARELTREAALAAGLPADTILLEEPQAALYAWLADMGDKWRRQLKVGDTLLVADVGGGTTDFTLIGVTEENGELGLRRIAVGSHTLVGGDNMDLALAHFATTAFAEKGVHLDPWQSVSLWHACRTAKESLLVEKGPKKHPVAVLGRGSKLIGGTVSVDLVSQAVRELLVGGFFPECKLDEKPERRRASGFRELGLPFEMDTAITRHLAAFLSAPGRGRPGRPPDAPAVQRRRLQGRRVPRATVRRDGLLVQEGRRPARRAAGEQRPGLRRRPRRRLLRLRQARQGRPHPRRHRPQLLRRHRNRRPRHPRRPAPLRGLCVVPFGMEEGTETDVPGEEIGLVVGEPATFRFFSSATRKHDRPGDLVPYAKDGDLEESDSMEADLPKPDKIEEDYVPVRFHSKINELGVFELWCVSTTSDQRWKLEFSVREDAEK